MGNIIGGDFRGGCAFKTKVLWFGPKADAFVGITNQGKTIPRDEIARIKELGHTESNSGGAAVAGAVAFGLVGAVVGAAVGRKQKPTYGVEFKDGRKLIFRGEPLDAGFKCFKLFADSSGLLDIDF